MKKKALYKCPACGRKLARKSKKDEIKSFCSSKGKDVHLKRIG